MFISDNFCSMQKILELSVKSDVQFPPKRSLKMKDQTKGTCVHICVLVHWGGLQTKTVLWPEALMLCSFKSLVAPPSCKVFC